MEAHFPWNAGHTGRSMKIISPLHMQRANEKGIEDLIPLLGCLYLKPGKGESAPHTAHTCKPLPMLLPTRASPLGTGMPASTKQPPQPPQPPALLGSTQHPHTAVPVPSPTPSRSPQPPDQLQCRGNETLADQALLLHIVHLPKDVQSWLEKPNVS